MSLNPARVGHRYAPFTYVISREKVREYAEVTGAATAAHRADPRVVPDADVPVPPSFAAVFTLALERTLQADPELGAHWNLVHGGQSFAFTRALRVGDVLVCTPHIVDIASRSRMDILTFAVDVNDAADDAEVLRAESTVIFFDDEAA